jgi:hypothetical protein
MVFVGRVTPEAIEHVVSVFPAAFFADHLKPLFSLSGALDKVVFCTRALLCDVRYKNMKTASVGL